AEVVTVAEVASKHAFFFFQAEDGIRDFHVTGVQTCALPISNASTQKGTGMAEVVEIAAMRRALELAARGPRSRNPQVGSVLLSPSGEILAEGWHRGAGTAHAEVDALSKLPEGGARGAT